MKHQVYFTREEAEAQVGQAVEALAPFPSVPKGSTGEVTKAARYAGERYVVEVRWELPRPNELVDLTVAEYSFNLVRRRKPVTDEFSKSDFSELVRIVKPVGC